MDQDNVGLCIVHQEDQTLESFILSTFNLSKSALKRIGLKKSLLTKKIKSKEEIYLPINLINYGKIKSSNISMVTLAKAKGLIAFKKKYNEHTHPLTYNEINNCLSRLKYSDPSLLKVNVLNNDRGLLYRLDFETSGLVLYATDDEHYNYYRKNFKNLVSIKEYLCIVEGKTSPKGILNDRLSRSGKKIRVQENGTLARLEFTTLLYNKEKDLSLLKVHLKEGLRHQIRVQLSNIGHPILGDTLYGASDFKRLFLHCYRYVLDGHEFIDSDFELVELFFDFNT
ncbi:MAG: RNA pseudouridine synthase [Bacteriovoracaceae bacterium]|nr:RNA pseudouridine synthase [Bacteriovoracaceae bacterium]